MADIGDGFALREGRIVATGHDATAELLMATGWSDRPLEIHRAEPRLPDYRTRGSSNPGQGRTPRGPNALAHKSHLSQQEAMAVINSLD